MGEAGREIRFTFSSGFFVVCFRSLFKGLAMEFFS